MDGLVQLYGPFDLDSDHLPHFDEDGKPIDGDTDTKLDSRLHIATSEGCCKNAGTGISSLVNPGRYVVVTFHCSIGPREHQPYKVTYTFDEMAKARELIVGRVREVEAEAGLYAVCTEGGKQLVTQDGDVYEVEAVADDAAMQGQVRVALFAYFRADILQEPDSRESEAGRHVAYADAFWGGTKVTGSVSGDQVSLRNLDLAGFFVEICSIGAFRAY